MAEPGKATEPRCSVCQHPDRAAIEQAILNGRPHREIAATFGFTYTDGATGEPKGDHKIIARHLDKHMAAAYQHAMEQSKADAGMRLVRRMTELDEVVDESLTRLRRGKAVRDEHGPTLDDDGTPLRRYDEEGLMRAVREGRRNVETLARLAGAMPEGDPEAVEAARRALASAAGRKMVADLEDYLATQER